MIFFLIDSYRIFAFIKWKIDWSLQEQNEKLKHRESKVCYMTPTFTTGIFLNWNSLP